MTALPGTAHDSASGSPGVAVEDSAAHIGAVLDPAVSTHDSPMGNIAVAAHNRLISKNSAPIRVAVIADNGVVIDPCIVLQFSGEVALALYKAAQLPGLYLLPDIPQGPDAVEKGIFLMGDIGQFVFLIDYCFISFLQTGEGPPLGTAPPVCFCLRF